MDEVYQAMIIVNRTIEEGRTVREHTFPSLDEARRRFPDVRAYEVRITGNVRVVEIDGYDHSACIKEHVSNTRECEFFIVKSISRERDISKVEYLVGDKAKRYAIESVKRLADIAMMLRANMNTLEATLSNILEELSMLRTSIRSVTDDAVSALSAVRVRELNLYYGSFNMLDDDILIKKASTMVKDGTDNKLIIFLNRKRDRSNVVIASNDPRLDSNTLLKAIIARYGGKGGGKAEFATGYIITSLGVDVDHKIKQEVMGLIEQLLAS
jgi:alanyl-tRNA synthetase